MITKETSFIECNKQIVEILRRELKPALNGFQRSNVSLHDYVRSLLRTEANLKSYMARCERASDAILEVWRGYGAEVENASREINAQKFLLPAAWTFPSIASRIGCYTDLMLIPDQTVHMAALGGVTISNIEEYLINYGGILQGAALLCPQSQEPIGAIIPEKDSRWMSRELTSRIACRILSEITETCFTGPEDAQYFLEKCESVSGLAREIRNPTCIPSFNQPYSVDRLDGWVRYSLWWMGLHAQQLLGKPLLSAEPNAYALWEVLEHSAGEILGLQRLASKFKTEIALDQHLYEFLSAANRTAGTDLGGSSDSTVVASLLTDELSWLGKVPMNKLLLLRNDHTVTDLRNIFSASLRRLIAAKPTEPTEVAHAICRELEEAFRIHQHKLENLKREQRRNRIWEWSGLTVSGVLAAVALIWPPAAIAGSLIGGSALLSLWRSEMSFKKESEDLRHSPIGVFFRASYSNPSLRSAKVAKTRNR